MKIVNVSVRVIGWGVKGLLMLAAGQVVLAFMKHGTKGINAITLDDIIGQKRGEFIMKTTFKTIGKALRWTAYFVGTVGLLIAISNEEQSSYKRLVLLSFLQERKV